MNTLDLSKNVSRRTVVQKLLRCKALFAFHLSAFQKVLRGEGALSRLFIGRAGGVLGLASNMFVASQMSTSARLMYSLFAETGSRAARQATTLMGGRTMTTIMWGLRITGGVAANALTMPANAGQ